MNNIVHYINDSQAQLINGKKIIKTMQINCLCKPATRPSPIELSPFISIPDFKKRFGLWGNAVLLRVANITQEREIFGEIFFT